MSSKISFRHISGVMLPLIPLGRTRERRVIISCAVVLEADAVALFAGVGVGRRVAAAGIDHLFPERGVREAPVIYDVTQERIRILACRNRETSPKKTGQTQRPAPTT